MSFDKIAAIYVFCSMWHSDQNSRYYRIMSRIIRQYKLKITDNCYQDILCSDTYNRLEKAEIMGEHHK